MDIMQKATICSAVCTEAKNLVKRAYFLEEWNMGSEPVRLQFLPLSDLNTGNCNLTGSLPIFHSSRKYALLTRFFASDRKSVV